jgi:hypothetical protein
MLRPRSTSLPVLVFLALLQDEPAGAQTVTSTLEGEVTDLSGAPLSGASVEVRGIPTTRELTTDEAGFYRVLVLPAGTYSVTFSLPGFETRVIEDIELRLDRTVIVDASLRLKRREEPVVVRADATLVDPSNPAMRQAIDERTIGAIPLDGRDYLDLVRLAPGVVVNEQVDDGFGSGDTRGAILGERAGNATFLIDGLANDDDFQGGPLQAYSLDAIQEFEVVQAGYEAEFGHGSGGVVNVITRSGSNDARGAAYLYGRDDGLDASNVPGEPPPKLGRLDAGATLGGPLRRDRAWYFGSYEYLKEDRAAIFPPDIPEVLRANEDFSRQPERDAHRALAKYTQKLGPTSDLRVAASWSQVERRNELAAHDALPSASRNNLDRRLRATASLVTVLGPNAYVEGSVGYRDQRFEQNQGGAYGNGYTLYPLDDAATFSFGPPPGSVQTLDQRYLTLRATLGLYAGQRHAFKVGGEYTHTAADGIQGQALSSAIVTTRDSFARYGLDSFQIFEGPAFLEPGDETARLRNDGVSLFAQDDWRVAHGLTLSLGLRYDVDSRFEDANNLAPRLGLTWRPDERTVARATWGLYYDRYRLGLAQPVPELGGFDSRIVVELSYPRLAADAFVPLAGSLGEIALALGDPFLFHRRFGIPADAVVTRDTVQGLTGLSPEDFTAQFNAYLAGLGLPFVPVGFSPTTGYLDQDYASGFQDQIRVARPFHTPYNRTLTLGVERAVRPGLSVATTWVHRQIENVLGARLTNLAYESRVLGLPVTTDGGPLQRSYGPWYSGRYDALVLAVERRFEGRFQLLASYTWSRSRDNLLNANLGSGFGVYAGTDVPTDNLDLAVDRGPSDLSVPHVFVVSGLLQLPAGLRLSGVFRLTSGFHFSAEGEPIDYDGDGLFSLRPPDTARNEFRGPGTRNLDLRLEERFRLGSGRTASLLVEAFNLTNERNPRTLYAPWIDGGPGPDFGEVRVPLPGREVQLGVRLEF